MKKVVKKVVKKAVKKKPVPKKSRKPSVCAIVEKAREEKDLYSAIPIKYRKKLRDVVNQCKEQGYVVSDVLMKHIGLDECDNTENNWECMEKILRHNCVDLVEEGGLLQEIKAENDSRFPDADPSVYDSIQMYLRDIGKYPLLNVREERGTRRESRCPSLNSFGEKPEEINPVRTEENS